MSRPTLSIITPSYNQAEFIERTIRSVLDQSYEALEYQVMDGGSKDGTIDILRRYEGKLAWVSERDGGQSAALNAGIRRTHGEIVGWINSDDLYLDGAFETVTSIFAARPDVHWIVGRCSIIDRNDRVQRGLITRYKEFFLRHYSYDWLLVENFISQPAVFVRRSLIDRVGLIDESYNCAMDYQWWLRMGAITPPHIVDRELARFRVWGENKMSKLFEQSFREELRAIDSVTHGSRPLITALHHLNRYKLSAAYRVMAALADRRQRAAG